MAVISVSVGAAEVDSFSYRFKDCGRLRGSLAKRLVGAKANDGQPKRIHGQFVVLHGVSKDVGDTRGRSFSFEFGMICRIREHLFELNSYRIWRLSKIVENDILDLDVDIREGAVYDIRLNDVVLPLLSAGDSEQ
jgi:hypothetical protein